MPLSTATITFDLADHFGVDYDTRRGIRAWVDTNIPDDTVVDTDGNKIRIGSGKVVVNADGTGSFTVWVPGTGSNPASWQTYVHFEYVPNGNPKAGRTTRTFGPFTITASGDLADLIEEQEVPPEYAGQLVAQMEALREDTVTARDEAVAIAAGDLTATFERKRPIDPRDYGTLGTSNDTATIQAALNAAGADGTVELPPMTMTVTGTLTIPSGCELRGTGMKDSVLACSTDKVTLKAIGGDGQSIKNLKILNTYSGVRTTYDIELVNPFKPVLEHVELTLGQTATGAGGVRIYKDVGQPNSDRCFMPQLIDVWIRNGVLSVTDVTDGKVSNSFIWATYTGAPGAVQMLRSSNWNFTDVDVVPPQGDAAAYTLGQLNNISIVGGLIDGSYDTIMTGHGVRSTDWVRGLSLVGMKFFNLGRSGVKLFDSRRTTVTGCIFVQNNKAEGAYPDIDLASCVNNSFTGNTHGAPITRTTKGKVYVEDASSSENLFAHNTIEVTPSHNYSTPLVTAQDSAIVKDNVPAANWPAFPGLKSTGGALTITKYDVLYGRTIWVQNSPTVTLPSSSSVFAGAGVTVKNNGTGTVTLAAAATQTIEGAASFSLTAGKAVTVQSTGGSNSWVIVGGYGIG